VRLISEIRRRNVFRTTLAYLAVSWLVVQVADIVLPTFGVAPWVMQALIVLFAAGFPAVVVLAWVYDLTPEGIVRTEDDAPPRPAARPLSRKVDFVIIGILSVALIMMVVSQHIVPVDVARLGSRSLIVLPFSTNQDEDDSLIADGLLGEILTQLYKIDALTTVGRTTAMHYRGSDKTVDAIAEEVGVATVLSGNIIEAEDKARFDVELLEAGSGRVLWGNSYELSRSVHELFQVQSDIATQVAIALKAELSPEEQQLLADRPTTSEEAYDHYIRGEGFRIRVRPQEAIEAYEQATQEDPEFAAAWAALAKAREEGSATGLADTTIAEAKFALEQAQRLAPDAVDTMLAEAGLLAFSDDRHEESAEIFHRVRKLRPGDVEPLIGLSQIYTVQLRLEEAQEFAEQAVALDPMSFGATWQLAFIHQWSWNFEEARRYYERTIAMEPESPHDWVFNMRYLVYLWGLGDMVAARQILEEAPSTISTINYEVGLAYIDRDLRKMQELLEDPEIDDSNRYGFLTRLYRLEGDVELQRQYADLMRNALEKNFEALLARGAPAVDVEMARSGVAVAHAFAGNEAEALRVIALAVERVEVDPDRLNAVSTYCNEVRVHALLGNGDIAIARLRSLLTWATPGFFTPHYLRASWDFDAIRDHPEFDAVLEEMTARIN
jgi:TolB-like protein/cytochrome c-type biogenesis protein CcmH/NrfG